MINYQPNSPLNNRFAVMVILGDMVTPYADAFWLDEMLAKLGLLGLVERTGRSTLARMTKDGWFEVERVGRRSRYTITAWGMQVLRQGDLRVFEEAAPAWDGHWHLASYSLPEEKRALRNQIRKQLLWLGYGNLSRGLWISPYDRRESLLEGLKRSGIAPLIHFFSGAYQGALDTQTMVESCWEIDKISDGYDQFLDRYSKRNLKNGKRLSAADAFLLRFRLSYDFLPLLREDPNLPRQFLPPDWVGDRARALYQRLREQIGEINLSSKI
ncbi:MAG: PaaX family transcriptional regulator C-terminal domain-containing protein [Chloroflexota bacterium]